MTYIPIYTIGYGGRSIEEFVKLLHHYEIKFLVDVRSRPYSRYNSEFSKDALQKYLGSNDIKYMFMGDSLGGRPDDDTCYDKKNAEEKRIVNYDKVREKPFFQKGISRLQTAWEKQLHIVVMCAEAKPQECHRSKLIGRTLTEKHITVVHIDEFGEPKSQEEIIQTIVNQDLASRNGQLSLFENPDDILTHSRKAYILPSERS